MRTALVITAYVPVFPTEYIKSIAYDTVICADGGYRIALNNNIKADYLIGDYDSMDIPEKEGIIKLPMEKDMTDTEAAIDLAISRNINNIHIIGGLGGRFDHTMGNLGVLSKYSSMGINIDLADHQNHIRILTPGTYLIPASAYKYLGIISYSDITTDLTLRGVKYPLTDFTLNNSTSLGVSNEITDEFAEISFKKGQLLVISSNDSEDLK